MADDQSTSTILRKQIGQIKRVRIDSEYIKADGIWLVGSKIWAREE